MNYKEILKGIVQIINTTEKSDIGFANICTYIGENCPELAESEDERVRKALMEMIYDTPDIECEEIYKISKEKCIAWFEKQAPKPQGKTALEAINEEKVDNANKVEPPQEIDGFDAELNALLKKYEHLPKEELQEPLEFYLGVVRDDLDIVREEKPKWSDDELLMVITWFSRIKQLATDMTTWNNHHVRDAQECLQEIALVVEESLEYLNKQE